MHTFYDKKVSQKWMWNYLSEVTNGNISLLINRWDIMKSVASLSEVNPDSDLRMA